MAQRRERSQIPKCTEHKHIALIKTHKTGAHIITNILQRYGETNSLNFVLPKLYPGEDTEESDLLGWPDSFSDIHVEEQINPEPFNILCNYARYSKEIPQVMPEETKYFTVLSDPASQIYLMYHALGLHSKDYGISFDDFMNKYQYMLTRYRGGEPIEVLTRNSQSFDLGLNNKENNLTKVREYIKHIEDRFSLVLIAEHLDESLVLLARRLCWPLEHVVYLPIRLLKQRYLDSLSDDLQLKARQHSSNDWNIYQYFNTSLWKQIEEYGPAFQDDLQTFKHKISIATKLCIEPAHMYKHSHSEDNTNIKNMEHDTELHDVVLKTNLKSKTYDYCLKLVLSNRGYTDRIRRQSQIKNDSS